MDLAASRYTNIRSSAQDTFYAVMFSDTLILESNRIRRQVHLGENDAVENFVHLHNLVKGLSHEINFKNFNKNLQNWA